MADETVGRQIPMAFLERVKDDFVSRYGGGMAVTSPANSLNKEFGYTSLIRTMITWKENLATLELIGHKLIADQS